MKDISFFFNPKSIAVIGASPIHGKLSNAIIRQLRTMEYPGTVYPVNPKYKYIDSMECYASLTAIKEDVDVVILCIPAPGVLDAMEDVVKKRVKGAIIVSAGF